jgi:neutral ceramidase
MTRFKKILVGLLLLILVLAVAFVAVVGPWPVYKDSEYKARYYPQAAAAIDAAVAKTHLSPEPKALQAGWATVDMTPKVGTPMAGYGGRPNEKRSTGVHDPLYVKAVVLFDGEDYLALVGADMLQTLPNLTSEVEKRLAAKTPITANQVLYQTSHSHCGPGGLAPGLAANISYGKYDPAVVKFLAERFSQAILDAYSSMGPARIAHGAVDVPEYIRNRTRQAPVDSTLNWLILDKGSGKRCYVMRYSAHPTVFGQRMLEFTSEYPGQFQRAVENETGAMAVYLGGAVGSMGPKPPEGTGSPERAEAMGKGLAKKLLSAIGQPVFKDHVDIVSEVSNFDMPPFQMRPTSPNYRVSPVFAKLFGVPPVGRMQVARVGDVLFVGMPYDFSGETSVKWQAWAKRKGLDLWVTSHSGAYLGYLSPDEYYNVRDEHGGMDYETGLMGWFGPNTEAYMTDLFQHAAEKLTPTAN